MAIGGESSHRAKAGVTAEVTLTTCRFWSATSIGGWRRLPGHSACPPTDAVSRTGGSPMSRFVVCGEALLDAVQSDTAGSDSFSSTWLALSPGLRTKRIDLPVVGVRLARLMYRRQPESVGTITGRSNDAAPKSARPIWQTGLKFRPS